MEFLGKLATKAGKIFDRLLDLLAMVAGIILSFITLSVCVAVFSRYFLNRPIGIVNEISEYSLVYTTFMVAAWVLRGNKHVTVDIVFDRLSPRNKCLTSLSTSIVAAIVFLLIGFYGVKVTRYQYSVGYYTPTILELPKFAISWIIPFGFFLLFIQTTRNALNHLKDLKTSKYLEKEGEGFKIEDVKM